MIEEGLDESFYGIDEAAPTKMSPPKEPAAKPTTCKKAITQRPVSLKTLGDVETRLRLHNV